MMYPMRGVESGRMIVQTSYRVHYTSQRAVLVLVYHEST